VRAIAVMLAIAAAAPAHADMDAERPPPQVRACRHAPSFATIEQCLRARGRVTVLRELPHARVVRIEEKFERGDDTDVGMSLYVERAGSWRLGGIFESQGPYELLAADTVRSGTHEGYRLDVGDIRTTSLSLDDVTSTPAAVRAHRVVLCSGDDWHCIEMMTACDVLVRGRTYFTFRGAVEVGNNVVRVAGDRRAAGTLCSVPASVLLGWTQ
jgi:hypothetical protein